MTDINLNEIYTVDGKSYQRKPEYDSCMGCDLDNDLCTPSVPQCRNYIWEEVKEKANDKVNIDVRRIGLVFTSPDRQDLGYLEWDEESTFTIRDSSFNEVNMFHVCDIKTKFGAQQVAVDHFHEINNSGE